MRYIVKIAIAALFFLSCVAAHAEDIKIAVVDVTKITAKMHVIAKANLKLRNSLAAESKAITQAKKTLAADVAKYNKSVAKNTSAELKVLQHSIDRQQASLQQREDALQKNYSALREQETKRIVQQLFGIVSKIAAQQKIDLVLFKDTVIYNGVTLDLTDQVITAAKSEGKMHE